MVAEWLPIAQANADRPWTEKTARQCEAALLRLPFADTSIEAITDDDVLGALRALKRVQAERIRQDAARVFAYAIGNKFRTGHNPAKFNDENRRHMYRAPSKNAVKHHARVARDDMPALYASIIDGDTARALRFLILTAARAGDVEGARWCEIHAKGATFTTASGDTEKLVCDAWIIPAERTKERQRHMVPLPSQAMEILGERGDAKTFLFGKLPANAMLNLLKKTHPDKTVHGCRSTFRDWAIRQTVALDHSATMRDLAELQQGHKLPGASATQLEYARDGLYDLRAPLMDKWADFVTGNIILSLTSRRGQRCGGAGTVSKRIVTLLGGVSWRHDRAGKSPISSVTEPPCRFFRRAKSSIKSLCRFNAALIFWMSIENFSPS